MRLITVFFFVSCIFSFVSTVSGPLTDQVYAFEGLTDKNETLADDIIKKCTIEGKNFILYAVVEGASVPKLVEVTGMHNQFSKKSTQVIMVYCELTPVVGTNSPNEGKDEKYPPNETPKTLELRAIKLGNNTSSDVKVLPSRMRVWTADK